MAIVRAVAVPSEPKRSGTTAKSVEAGVTQDRVSRVPAVVKAPPAAETGDLTDTLKNATSRQ
jgi:hypothetical protein